MHLLMVMRRAEPPEGTAGTQICPANATAKCAAVHVLDQHFCRAPGPRSSLWYSCPCAAWQHECARLDFFRPHGHTRCGPR